MYNTKDLTVCSVSFGNAKHLRLNKELACKMNSDGEDLQWIIAENTPQNSSNRLDVSDHDFNVIEGIEGGRHTPTYHHTLALRKSLKKVKTRFVLVLDPDFYIVRKNWISTMLNYMTEQKLALLGVPWHPRYMDKYRYFPAVHCTVFDTEKFDINHIDFRPDYPDGDGDPLWPNGYEDNKKYFCTNPMSRFLSQLSLISERRRFYTDTGGRLYKNNILQKDLNYECLLPVFSALQYPNTLSLKGKILEKLLPDELCYFPKRKGSYCQSGFIGEAINMVLPKDWEEFVWKDKAFGFHVRRNAKKDQRSATDEMDYLENVIKRVFELGGVK